MPARTDTTPTNNLGIPEKRSPAEHAETTGELAFTCPLCQGSIPADECVLFWRVAESYVVVHLECARVAGSRKSVAL